MRPITGSTLLTRALLLSLLVAGALVLTGCLGATELGNDEQGTSTIGQEAGPSGSAAQVAVLAAASAETTTAGPVKLALTMELLLPGSSDRVNISLEGAFDAANERGRFVVDYGSLLASIGPGSEQVSAFLPDRLIFVEQVLYLRMPNLEQVVPGSKKWLKLSAEELAAQQGLDITDVDQLGQANSTQLLADPAQILALLESLEGSVEEIGAGTVRGQDATHYRATIDMTKLAAAAPPDQQAVLEAQLAQLSELGLDQLPIEVWIDGQGRIVRLSSAIAVPDTGAGAGAVSLDLELYDFGAPITIKTPDETKVGSIDTVVGALGLSVQG